MTRKVFMTLCPAAASEGRWGTSEESLSSSAFITSPTPARQASAIRVHLQNGSGGD